MPAHAIPLNDLGRHAIQVSEALCARAREVVEGGHYVLGPNVATFEREFAQYCRVRHCIGVGNGTDALELALRGCGIGDGDGVVVCANAAMYGTVAILAAGAVPVFADVDARGLLTSETVAAAASSAAVTPRALIATHLYGRMADMPALLAAAKEHELMVVEDCAQAHGARSADGRMAGSFGDAAAFSFYPTKNLGAVGDGGAVLSNDDTIGEHVRQLRQYGWSRKYHNTIPGGRNSRLDEMQAAFLCELLPNLDARNARRRSVASRYSARITNPAIRLPDTTGDDYVAHLYVVHSASRESLADHLAHAGIASDVHYPTPDYWQPAIADNYPGLALPMTESVCAEVLTLPCFPELTDAECDAVITACNAWVPA